MSDQASTTTTPAKALTVQETLAQEPESVKIEALKAKEYEDVGLQVDAIDKLEEKIASTIRETLGLD